MLQSELDICMRQNGFKRGPRNISAGIDRAMDALGFHLFQQFRTESAVQQGFPSGNRDSAAVRIEDPVLKQFLRGFLDRDRFAEELQSAGRTFRFAFPASLALRTIELVCAVDDPVAGTDFRAFAAKCAFRIMDREFRLHESAFRIVTPNAPQGTPFQKERSTDSRSVMDRKTFDVDVSCTRHIVSPVQAIASA